MSSDWKPATLDQLAEDVTVGHVGPMASEYVSAGVPFLRSQNVEPFRIDQRDIKYISREFHEKLKKSALKPGDVVIVRTGKPGACAMIPDSLPQANCSDLVIVRCSSQLDPRFLVYYINSSASHQVSANLVGAVQQHFNVGSAREMQLCIPGLPEQLAIAHVLGTLDDKIELNRRINETLEAIAGAIFMSWFVDFDPVRAKASDEPAESICRRLGLTPELLALFPDRFQDSELGEIPEGWQVITIGELCERVSMGPFGSDIKTSNFVPEGVPIIRGRNLTNGFIDNDFVFLTEAKGDELRNSNARGGDIVITHRGTLGQVGLIPTSSRYPRYVVSQSQMVLTPRKERTTSRFIYEFLRSPTGQHSLLANTSQVGVPAIARPTTSVKAISLVAPPPESVRAYDSIVDPLFNRVLSAIQESNSLAALRDSLLPKLLSGELHVPAGAV